MKKIETPIYSALYFNSTIVRLKQYGFVDKGSYLENFNSTIVRLKHVPFNTIRCHSEFQFYNSAIKANWLLNNNKMGTIFQFYNSAIKAISAAVRSRFYYISILQ